MFIGFAHKYSQKRLYFLLNLLSYVSNLQTYEIPLWPIFLPFFYKPQPRERSPRLFKKSQQSSNSKETLFSHE